MSEPIPRDHDPQGVRHTRTIRMRLTLIYGSVFTIMGAVALVLGFLLVHHNITAHAQSLQRTEVTLTKQFRHTENRIYREFKLLTEKDHGHMTPKEHREYTSARKSLIDALAKAAYSDASNNTLRKLLKELIAALFVMILIAVVTGWIVAGRALEPLREITSAARRVSGENLGERIGLTGPSDELKELADTFDAMLERLDQTFASQRHFVANASHELRTPLAIMRTEIDVTLADPDASIEDLREMGEAVRETIDRGEALVSALLQLARSEAITGHEELVDMAEMAGDVITDLHHRAEAADVRIVADLRPAVAFGESALLERVLTNLIDNGIRHNHEGGSMWVTTRTRKREPMIEIDVKSDGAELDPQQVPALTEPFRRVSRTTGGFGLGLSIVKSVAAAHGGTIELEARPEGGLEVKVELPSAAYFQPTAFSRARKA
jgi:signal transduction histidine kinase